MSAKIATLNSQSPHFQTLRISFGDAALRALEAPDTTDLLLNPDGKLWRWSLGGGREHIGAMDSRQAMAVVSAVAGFYGKEVTPDKPLLDAVFPLDGSRFAGQIPPVVAAPAFAIRRKAVKVLTLEDYVQKRVMTPLQASLLRSIVGKRLNILVIGGTRTGKTTLTRAISQEIIKSAPRDRIVILEDQPELDLPCEDQVALAATETVPMSMLVKATMRMTPDRIFVGEVRGTEAFELLEAWNTGHEGSAATIHANDPRGGLRRLETLISRMPNPPANIQSFVADVAHVLVHITCDNQDRRRVAAIMRVRGYENGNYILHEYPVGVHLPDVSNTCEG